MTEPKKLVYDKSLTYKNVIKKLMDSIICIGNCELKSQCVILFSNNL